jgi:adenylate kinase family enzyme
MERVLVIGSPGAGKSTLAAEVARLTGLPLVHLDQLHWSAGWVESTKAEMEAKVREAIARPRWVIDGNYGGTLPLRLTRADTVIDLDLPRWLCVFSIVRRAISHRGRTRSDMAPGCPERLDWEFLAYTFHFPGEGRRRLEETMRSYAGRRIRLRSRREVKRFLARVEAEASGLARTD